MTSLLLATLLWQGPAVGERAQKLPQLTAKPLSGQTVRIPGEANIAAYVLSFGFSRKSDQAMKAWREQVFPAFAQEPRVAYYEMPVLQRVPGLIKPLVLRGMRGSIPKDVQPRFAPLYQQEAELKALVHFAEPDAAYLVVAKFDGAILWTGSAPASPERFAELRKAVAALLAR